MAASIKSVALPPDPPLSKVAADLADSAPLRDALQWFVRQKQWINEQHLQLCRIPASTFFEQARAEWMLAQFRALGCVARIDRGGNVVAHPLENRTGPYIALTAHLDTVLAPRKDEEVYVAPDGRLHGPGVADNGAGLAALLAIARAVQSFPNIAAEFRNLVFIANVGEEGEGNLSGMRYLCRQSSTGGRIQAFLILDGPNIDHVTSQALASRRFDVTISGPGGHSWSDYGFANPIHALARAIASFTEQRLPTNGSPRSSYNFGIIEGGSSINSIPTLARTKVDIRSESPAKLDEIAAQLTTTVERAHRGGERPRHRRQGHRQDQRDRLAARRPAARRRLHPASHPRRGRAPGNPLASGLRFHRRQHSSVHGPSRHFHRRGRTRRRRAHPQEWFHPEGRELGLKRILLTLSLLLRDLDSHPNWSAPPATLPERRMNQRRPAGWLVDGSLVMITLIWGATFVLVKRALADASTLLFLTIRFAAAAFVLALVFRKDFRRGQTRNQRPGRRAGRPLPVRRLRVSNRRARATPPRPKPRLSPDSPLRWSPCSAASYIGERPSSSNCWASAIAFLGMALMTMPGDRFQIDAGDLWVSGCAVAYAFHILLTGRFASEVNIGVFIVTQIATGAAVGAATFWWAEPVRVHWSPPLIVALAVTSLFATALGFSIQTWAQRWTSPTRTALIFAMEPVFAWITSYLVAGEVLSRRATLGAALIIGGILMVELKTDG